MYFDCPECECVLEYVGLSTYHCPMCDETFDIEELLPPVFDVVDEDN